MTHEQHRKEVNKLLTKPLAYTAGILGLIQGIAWLVLSILSILCYFESIFVSGCNIEIENGTVVGGSDYSNLLYCLFLKSDFNNSNLTNISIIIKPDDFIIFVWFYVIFSAIWTCTSASIIWAMIHNQWQLTKTLFGAWSATVILTSIVDIVLTGLIVADYVTIEENLVPNEIVTTYGIVMSLAARGYILWILNVVFAAIMTKFTIKILQENNTTLPIIHGYESNEINPPWFNGSVKDFWASPNDNTNSPDNVYDNQGFRRSQSFYPMDMTNEHIYSTPPTESYIKPIDNANYKTPSNVYSPPPGNPYKTPTTNKNNPSNKNPMSFSEAIAQRTATIGKNKGKRSPLNHIAPPYIPDPDYTPPNSPHGLKSVLRSKSNYSNMQ